LPSPVELQVGRAGLRLVLARRTPPMALPSHLASPSTDRSGGVGELQRATVASNATNPSSSPRRLKKAVGNFMAEARRVYFRHASGASHMDYSRYPPL